MKSRVFVSCFLIFLSLSVVSWALNPKDPALVAIWLCDEGKGDTILDTSGNKNDATGTFKWTAGKFGSGLEITSGSIDVKTSDSINSIKKAITVAAWFNITGDSDTGIRRQNAFLLEDQSASEPVPDGFSFRLWTTSGLSPGVYGVTKLKKNEWYHVAGTYDGKLMKLYINGVAEPELLSSANAKVDGAWSGDIGTPADTLQLKYAAETYIGLMDEIVLFNRALAADEIMQLTKGWKAAMALESNDKLSATWGQLKSSP